MSEPIWSTGGTGGEHAVIEDLDWAVSALREAARDVASAKAELARRRAAMALDPSVGNTALAARLAHVERSRVARVGDELDDTATRLSAVSRAYLDAERRAQRRLGLGQRAREVAQDGRGTVVWAAQAAAAAGLVASVPGEVLLATGHVSLGDVAPDDAPPTTAVLNRDALDAALDTPVYEALAAVLQAISFSPILAWLTHWRGYIESQAVAMTPAQSLRDIMRRLLETEDASGGAVRIERWTDAAGVTHRVVFIPGTEDWLNIQDNPFDLQADLLLAMGRLPDAAMFVAAALAADGARPGDPVLLAGHSLGGTIATALAANPNFRQRFGVTAVITAGSPTGRIDLPRSVNALHLEGTRDIVPGLDGRPNPDTPTRTTVSHDARTSQLPELEGEGETIPSAHHLDVYAQTARLVDEGLSPSTDAWLTQERAFFEPGADVVVTEYRPTASG